MFLELLLDVCKSRIRLEEHSGANRLESRVRIRLNQLHQLSLVEEFVISVELSPEIRNVVLVFGKLKHHLFELL